MRVPIICMDQRLRQFVRAFRSCFSLPQYRYFVIVLLALMLCQEPRTLTALLRCVAVRTSLSGLSRFLAKAPWEPDDLAHIWRERFDAQVREPIAQAHARQRAARLKRLGRPTATVVTGYLIGDDSTMHKLRGKKMAALGKHYSTTAGKPVVGHSLVQALYVVEGRRCPLAPQLYRQQAVCLAEDVPFESKIDLMVKQIEAFRPLAGTLTHVLLDSWFSAKRIWKAARERGFVITTGLKSNRSLRVPDKDTPRGWRWQRLAEYAAGLTEADYQMMTWPSQGDEPRQVWVHVVSTRVRKLYRCQVVIVRESLEAPLKETRFWASSDLTAQAATLLSHIAARWDVEVLFADAKELLGLDQYQVMSSTALVRFWTLVLAAYAFLDEERDRLRQTWQCHVTIGEARREVQRVHWCHLSDWMHRQFQQGATPQTVSERLAA
jgi:SRSO17 transposase